MEPKRIEKLMQHFKDYNIECPAICYNPKVKHEFTWAAERGVFTFENEMMKEDDFILGAKDDMVGFDTTKVLDYNEWLKLF